MADRPRLERLALVIPTGPGEGAQWLAGPGASLRIGSDPEAEVRLLGVDLAPFQVAVACRSDGARARSLDPTQPTLHNGAPLGEEEVLLAHGDELAAGRVRFVARLWLATPGEAEPVLRVGAWSFGRLPEGWRVVPELGLRGPQEERPDNVVVVEDRLDPGASLEPYVDAQMALLAEQLRAEGLEKTGPVPEVAAEETLGLRYRFAGSEGVAHQRQVYARWGRQLGVATLTTPDPEREGGAAAFAAILDGLRFEAQPE